MGNSWNMFRYLQAVVRSLLSSQRYSLGTQHIGHHPTKHTREKRWAAIYQYICTYYIIYSIYIYIYIIIYIYINMCVCVFVCVRIPIYVHHLISQNNWPTIHISKHFLENTSNWTQDTTFGTGPPQFSAPLPMPWPRAWLMVPPSAHIFRPDSTRVAH